MASLYVAQPSFNQPWLQSWQVNRSPNHWCASSWAMRVSALQSRHARPSVMQMLVSVVAATFSIPPKMKSSTTTWSSRGQG